MLKSYTLLYLQFQSKKFKYLLLCKQLELTKYWWEWQPAQIYNTQQLFRIGSSTVLSLGLSSNFCFTLKTICQLWEAQETVETDRMLHPSEYHKTFYLNYNGASISIRFQSLTLSHVPNLSLLSIANQATKCQRNAPKRWSWA